MGVARERERRGGGVDRVGVAGIDAGEWLGWVAGERRAAAGGSGSESRNGVRGGMDGERVEVLC
jgi:hypothetical protein